MLAVALLVGCRAVAGRWLRPARWHIAAFAFVVGERVGERRNWRGGAGTRVSVL